MKVPALRFTPTAWAQYLTIRDSGDTEVGAYGVTSEKDPLLVIGLVLPKQTVSVTSVDVDGDDLLDLTEAMDKLGYSADRWSRVWCHTHPGNSATPSSVDEAYFKELDQEWSAMVILAENDETYCRFSWCPKSGAVASAVVDIEIDYECDFPGTSRKEWLKECDKKVTRQVFKAQPFLPAKYRAPLWSPGVNVGQVTQDNDDATLEEYLCTDCNKSFIFDLDEYMRSDEDWVTATQCPNCTSNNTHITNSTEWDDDYANL